jgi:isochorismate synthase
LCDKYVNAFVYLFQIPGAGCWIGATPEPLLLINDDIAETISLAGTQKLENNVSEEIHWPEKFIEEQAFVTNYIENVLLTFGVKTYQKIGPFSQSAGNLIHLKTKFLFKSKALQNSLGEFVDLLYPTPSICGLPRNNTFDILANIEAHDREYYTGLLGPVNMNEETNLFVNLRCLKVLKTELALFLGAGITTGSVPDDEWEETNQKKMTLLSVIQN